MKKIKKYLSSLGPGFITGASDDDPSGIATYSQTGSLFGYNQLWTALFGLPFMSAVQEMCGRIGLVTGKGLAGVLRKYYAKPVLYTAVFLLLIANTINIGADLGAMAEAGQMLFGVRFIYWLLGITVLTLVLEIFVSYKTYARFLKYLTFSLFSYVIAAFIVHQDWTRIAYTTLVPNFSFNKDYLLNVVAILGTTISPYLFFWQAGEEVEEEIEEGKLRIMGQGQPLIHKTDIKKMRFDTFSGMFFSQAVMFFIIVTTASTLYVNGIHNIETATQAASALRPLAGEGAYLLFALGIIGTGLLAVPVLAGSASYALSEAFGWREGLYRKVTRAHGFYGVITIATLVGLLVNFTPLKPFQMLYYTAVLNGIVAPPLLIMILLIANNKNVLGKYTNSRLANILGWGIVIVMSLASFGLFMSLFWQ